MNEHGTRVETLVEQVLMTIHEPWESLRYTLDQHPYDTMGDPARVGSGAWHLVHLCEVFRIHAKAFVGAETIEAWPPMPMGGGGLEEMVAMLRDDADRFAAWCRANRDRIDRVTHGEEMPFEVMMGVMHRHIVWHAAAVHYWCLW